MAATDWEGYRDARSGPRRSWTKNATGKCAGPSAARDQAVPGPCPCLGSVLAWAVGTPGVTACWPLSLLFLAACLTWPLSHVLSPFVWMVFVGYVI